MHSRRWIVRIFVAVGLASCLTACTSPEEKVQKAVQKALQTCQEGDAPFAKVKTMTDDATEVLKLACDKPLGEVKFLDEFSAEVAMGPYTWNAGLYEETQSWRVFGVSYPTLERARAQLDEEDPSIETLKSIRKQLKEVEEAFPESAWVRSQRLKNLLAIRRKQRAQTADEDPGLGEEAEAYMVELKEWVEANKQSDVLVEAYIDTVDYFKAYRNQMELALESLGSGDDHLMVAIANAEKTGDQEEAKKYRQELETRRETRDEDRQNLENRVESINTLMCQYVSDLGGLEPQRQDLIDRATTVRTSINCVGNNP